MTEPITDDEFWTYSLLSGPLDHSYTYFSDGPVIRWWKVDIKANDGGDTGEVEYQVSEPNSTWFRESTTIPTRLPEPWKTAPSEHEALRRAEDYVRRELGAG